MEPHGKILNIRNILAKETNKEITVSPSSPPKLADLRSMTKELESTPKRLLKKNATNDNYDTITYHNNRITSEIDNLIESETDLKKKEFNLQKTIDLEKNDPNLNTPNSLVSQKSDLKYNAAKIGKNVIGFVNKLSSLKKRKKFIPESKEIKPTNRPTIIKRFQRSFQIIKVIFRLRMISEDIQTYGTSSNLFDLTTRDRTTVKKVLYPLNEENETKNLKADDIKLPFPILHPKSRIKLLWTPIVVLLLLYTATLMPYVLVFFDYDDNDWTNPWVIFQMMVDMLFWLDLLMNLISAYYNEEGILVRMPKEILVNYLKGWLFIDLIACLPFNYIGDAFIDNSSNGGGKLHLVRLSRVPRLYRLIKITKIAKVFRFLTNDSFVMEYFEFNSGIMRLITLLFSVSILIHLMGCLWYYEAKMDDFGPDTWVFRNNMQDNSNLSLYMASIYFALTTLATVGYGDICAKTNTEMITSIIWMLFGVGFYSFTIGILSSVLAYIDTKATNLQKKIAIMNEFCNEMKISKSLKERLRKTLEYNSQKNSFTWAEKTNIFNDLPINLRYEIVMNVHDKVISEILFFKNCDDKFFVVRTVPLLKPLFLKSKENIWTAGTNPDAIYFLINGRVNYVGQFEKQKSKPFSVNEIVNPDETKKSFIFKSMVAGSYFGEIEILFKRRRDFSVICEMDSELYYLSRYDFENILVKEFPHIADQMKSVAKKRDKINKQAMEDVSLLLKTAKEITFDKNETLKDTNVQTQKGNSYSHETQNLDDPKNDQKSLKDVVNKFKSKLNRNRIFPEITQGIQIEQIEDKKVNENSVKETTKSTSPLRSNENGFDGLNGFEKKEKKQEEEIPENRSQESRSSSSSNSENSPERDEVENEKNTEKNTENRDNDPDKITKNKTEEELMILRGEIQKNEERQLALEEKIKEIHKTLETTFSLIKELLEE